MDTGCAVEGETEAAEEAFDIDVIDEAMAIYVGPKTTFQTAAVNILSDLMRWCSRVGVDFDAALDTARSNNN